jgi:nitroreductase
MPNHKEKQSFEKPAPAAYPVHELIRRRWSPRAFTGQSVDRYQLAQLFEAARWAPSSSNEQPWTFLIAERGTAGWQKLFDTLVPFNQAWAKAAPMLVLGLARKTFAANNNPNRFALYDLGQAVGKLLVQATALGLSVHQMAGFDAEKARTAFGIPENYEVGSMMTIGHAAHPESLSEQLREREVAPRTRNPIESFVFEEELGRPAEFPPDGRR